MSSEWPIEELESISDEVTVGYVGSMASEYVESGIPFLRSLNIEPFGINQNDLKFISLEFHKRIRKSSLRPGDVAIVRTGKPGTCAVIPDWLADANCSDLVIVRCGKKIRPHFLCYWINSVASHHIDSHLVGAVQQHFNVGAAKKMKVAAPPLHTQDQIIAILGSLDNRIALLRETNATLEAIAQALFKSWFVDFDPVRANVALPPSPCGRGSSPSTRNCRTVSRQLRGVGVGVGAERMAGFTYWQCRRNSWGWNTGHERSELLGASTVLLDNTKGFIEHFCTGTARYRAKTFCQRCGKNQFRFIAVWHFVDVIPCTDWIPCNYPRAHGD